MFLSKSDFMMANNCIKALWLKKNRKDLLPKIDEETQFYFDVGNIIQDLARQYFPNGVMVEAESWDVINGSKLTKELSEKHPVLFEAFAKLDNGAFCRIDVLEKNGNKWNLIEIKSGGSAKPEYIQDLAFQKYVFQNAGYPIQNCKVLFVNTKYMREKELDIKQLFTLEDVSEGVEEYFTNTPALADLYIKKQTLKKEPKAPLKSSCSECPFYYYCGKDVPEYSVFDLLKGKTGDVFYAENKTLNIEDVPASACTTPKQIIEREAYLTQKIHCEPKKIKEFLDTLQYPIYYLDFETLMPAIPPFEKSKPYGQIPFQYSLHIQKEKNGLVEHKGYLHCEKSDPRRKLAEHLIQDCGKSGSIVTYNADFETARIKEMAEIFPDLREDLLALTERMVDQLDPFADRILYSPKQMGSASIKYVLPAFSDLSYKDMEVHHGGEAMTRYQAFQEGRLTPEQEQILFKGLDEYCGQDTYAMVILMKVLEDYSKQF